MVFVTGATGLIGSYLLLELAKRGKKIRAMKRKNSSLEPVKSLFQEFSDLASFEKIEWVETDLLDIPSLVQALKGVETIFHTAASVGFDDRSRQLIHEVNELGTENLVNLALTESVSNFVYISSIAVLDGRPSETLITETSIWDSERPHSEYAISKKKGEMSVWRGAEEGLNVTVVYPAIVIGSLDGKRASEKIFKMASAKKTFGTQGKTGYVDVRDVVHVLAELYERGIWNDKFILCSEKKSYLEILNYIRQKWSLKPASDVSFSKLKFAYKASRISRFFGGPYMSKSSLMALTADSNYSSQKIQELLDFKFRPVEEALDFHASRYQKIISK